MKRRKLLELGIPKDCLSLATKGIGRMANQGREMTRLRDYITRVIANPADHINDEFFGELAQEIIAISEEPEVKAVSYKVWGKEGIEKSALDQMEFAATIPSAISGALMADAHQGYGLPIGGVLACENAVIPYAVGVDIACRMKLSILDIKAEELHKATSRGKIERFKDALEKGTQFGLGCEWYPRKNHEVMDKDWDITPVTSKLKDKAYAQLGTSGGGNHFVEIGLLTIKKKTEMGLDPGEYVAIMSHSGSRGAGASVCKAYHGIAHSKLPIRYQQFKFLPWLDMDTEEGQSYWAAMNLMGDYASANHDIIHRLVSHIAGGYIVKSIENHHNFAWLEEHQGKKLYVHRKGATPAGKDVLGVIPGSMGDPAFVVKGKGNDESLKSASHGAGRLMSRKKGKETFNFKAVQGSLASRGITVLSAGADEVPGVYKNILQVMKAQEDLVTPLARFDPKVVKMSG